MNPWGCQKVWCILTINHIPQSFCSDSTKERVRKYPFLTIFYVTHWICTLVEILIIRETPYLFSQYDFPSLPSNVCGEKSFFCPSPSLSLILVHVQFICFLQYIWAAVYPNSFYPVTGLPVKRTAVTQIAHYRVGFGTSQRIFMYKELTAAPFVVITSVFCLRKTEAIRKTTPEPLLAER